MMRRISYRLSNSVVWEPQKFSIIRKKLVTGQFEIIKDNFFSHGLMIGTGDNPLLASGARKILQKITTFKYNYGEKDYFFLPRLRSVGQFFSPRLRSVGQFFRLAYVQ